MNQNKESAPLLTMAALGVVFGDIGTSPLYTLSACLSAMSLQPSTENLLDILSLIFWALILVVGIKYAWVVMRADNHGEGGIMALTALASRATQQRRPLAQGVLAIGLLGAALFYGDGVITPAISVLSATEGIEVANPAAKAWVIPLALGIIFGLFLVQHRGTAAIAHLFGPGMLIWFLILFLSGLRWLAADPRFLLALNPWFALHFFGMHGIGGIAILGAVVLAVTGAEALYADMGHFGSRPIRAAWFLVVLPALTVNYLGQGALLDRNPAAIQNPFFRLFPHWATLPMVVVSGIATVIASQAVISGAYSATYQALLLGYLPRLKIVHTSEVQRGQIYLPALNWLLMAAVIAVLLWFRSAGALSSAYGTAVTGTMILTTILIVVVARPRWRWPAWQVGLFFGFFVLLDGLFFGANLMKFLQGGWFPLGVGAAVFTLMSTWHREREILTRKLYPETLRVQDFLDTLSPSSPLRVPGTAVYLTAGSHGVPHALLQNLTHNKVLHEQVVILTVLFEEEPRIPPQERAAIRKYEKGFLRLTARYGFMEHPDIPALLDACAKQGFLHWSEEITYFLSRQRVVFTRKLGMGFWRERLFALMLRLSASGSDFFRLPPAQVMELGGVVDFSPEEDQPGNRRKG
ncbi:MAG: potassium transporter Kup [Candidatus Methylacidiphilaceae bacterium]